jgi:hypothetical protein
MQCILYKIYFFGKFSHVLEFDMHFICTPMWTKNFILVKSGCYRFRPNRPSPEQPRPLHPQAALRALGPLSSLSLSSLGIFAKRRLFFEFAQSVNGVSSHVAANWAPPVRSTPFLTPTDPKHASPRASPQLIALHLPASIIATPIKAAYSPALIPPLESLLTPLPPAINDISHKSPAVTHRHFHPEHPRPPIKGEHPPPSFTAPLPASFPLSPRLSSTHRAPTPPNLHRRRSVSTLLLHLE